MAVAERTAAVRTRHRDRDAAGWGPPTGSWRVGPEPGWRRTPVAEMVRTMSVGRVLLIVFGAILGLIGLALLAGGGALLYADQALRDGSGYFTSAHERFRTPTRAIVSEGLDLGGVPGGPGRWADLRVRVTGAGGRPVFVGVGPKADVQRYLAGVGQAELTKLDFDPFHATYRDRPGTRVPAPPGDQSFWAAKVQGSGTQTLTWKVESGNWQIVAMNPDGSAGVDATASVGVKVSYVLAVAIGLLVVGLLLLGGGITMIVFGARSPRGPPPPAVAAAGAPGAPAPPEPGGGPGSAVEAAALPPRASTYPVDLTGTLDPGLTRWQWLFKWLLAIPHYVILFFLWIAYFVVSVIAFFAILFTGRYPRGLFEFNSGVLRWSWRVGFYSYSALGTDRYPPFALGPADYPADIEVPYPERLSRGLVLVKWWLLAIPQYIIVAIFTGNWVYGSAWGDRWYGWAWTPIGGGLIGILVLFAGVALLFTGRYPRGLFDLVIGLNRWVYRVVAYASLMRDEYPPFRLER